MLDWSHSCNFEVKNKFDNYRSPSIWYHSRSVISCFFCFFLNPVFVIHSKLVPFRTWQISPSNWVYNYIYLLVFLTLSILLLLKGCLLATTLLSTGQHPWLSAPQASAYVSIYTSRVNVILVLYCHPGNMATSFSFNSFCELLYWSTDQYNNTISTLK